MIFDLFRVLLLSSNSRLAPALS